MDIATDIKDALKSVNLWAKFQKLPPSHQKEYLTWINSAKKPATRSARITIMLQMLHKK